MTSWEYKRAKIESSYIILALGSLFLPQPIQIPEFQEHEKTLQKW